MRSSIGGTWILQLMVIFIFLFAGFIILNINYSKTIRVKNEMVNIIEKYEGLNTTTITLLNNYLKVNGYDARGVCSAESARGIYGAYSLDAPALEEVRPKAKYYYCVKKFKGISLTNYYQVSVFYKFNIPVIGETSGFIVKGTTHNFNSADNYDIVGD